MSETKLCTRCNTERSLDAFTQGQSWCRPCFRQYGKEQRAKKRAEKRKKPAANHPWRVEQIRT